MANTDALNHDLLIVTEKTPHICRSTPNADVCLDPKTHAVFPFNNWHETKKLRAAGSGKNTRNTFIDNARVFIVTGRIDADSESDHPQTGLIGKKSLSFRGDTEAYRGSKDLKKEAHFVMRTTDITTHNCMPKAGPSNCDGKVYINAGALDRNKALKDSILKKCTVKELEGKCKHGRKAPNGKVLEVVADEEKMTFEVKRVDTSVEPEGKAKCQLPGKHSKWVAVQGSKVLKEKAGSEEFEFELSEGIPSQTGIFTTVAWLARLLTDPKYVTVSAEGCAGALSTQVRSFPGGKVSIDGGKEITAIKEALDTVKQIFDFIQDISALLNGGTIKKSGKWDFLPPTCTLSFEGEFKERKDHLVGLKWKLDMGFDPVIGIEFKWPIPIQVFLGPFGAIAARGTIWVLDKVGLHGDLTWGFIVGLKVIGTIERDQEGAFKGSGERALTLTPNITLALSKGPENDPDVQLTISLGVDCKVSLYIEKGKPPKLVQLRLAGSIAFKFTIAYKKKGYAPNKLFEYAPDWAKWPKDVAEGATARGFILPLI